MSLFGDLYSGARFSPCRRYRYELWRRWNDAPMCNFVMLNPSTADEEKNDRTVTRCIRFAQRWKYGGLYVTNVFAWRATDPAVLKTLDDPVGPGNDHAVRAAAEMSRFIVAAWSDLATMDSHATKVLTMLSAIRDVHCLGRTKAGNPRHPLYIKADFKPLIFGSLRWYRRRDK